MLVMRSIKTSLRAASATRFLPRRRRIGVARAISLLRAGLDVPIDPTGRQGQPACAPRMDGLRQTVSRSNDAVALLVSDARCLNSRHIAVSVETQRRLLRCRQHLRRPADAARVGAAEDRHEMRVLRPDIAE